MISVSDAARFTEEGLSTKKFKTWRDIALDYLTLILLLLTIFSWAKVVSDESSGLVCVTIDPNVAYNFNLAKYFNSRCAQAFEKKILLYYPYLLFLQWMILSALQKLWLKLPVVKCKFDSYHALFKEMTAAVYVNKTSPDGNDVNNSLVADVYEKLLLLLEEKTNLVYIYTAKVSMVFASCLAMFCMIVAWATSLDFFQANFPCTLTRSYSPVRDFICNFKPAEFLYIIIICNILVLSFILLLSGYNFFWVFARKWITTSERSKLLNENTESFQTMRGYGDLCFCLVLMTCSIQENEAVKKVLSMCNEKFFHAKQMRQGKVYHTEQTQISKRINGVYSFESRDFVTVKYICDQLGLSIEPDESEKEEFIHKELAIIERALINDLERKEDINGSKNVLKVVERYLQKFSTTINKTIVLIHPYYGDDLTDLFKPSFTYDQQNPGFKKSGVNEILFICFLRPMHFHMTSQVSSTPLFRDRRLKYMTDRSYRKTLQQEAVFRVCHRNKRRSCALDRRRQSLQFVQHQEPSLDCLVDLGEHVLHDECLDKLDDVKEPFIKKKNGKKFKRVHFTHT